MSERFTMGVRGIQVLDTTPADLTGGQMGRAVYMQVSGDITFTMEDGTTGTLEGMAAGVWHPMRFTAITGITTAEGVVVGF